MSKFALISPLEVSHLGFRVADVVDTTFDIAEPMFWVEVADNFVSTNKYFIDGQILDITKDSTNYQAADNSPSLEQKNENVFIYTFLKGQELAEHNHVNGGRHITVVKSGTFSVNRKVGDVYQEAILKSGDITSFTKEEFHSITCKTKGVIHNITIQDKLSNFMFKKRLIDIGAYSDLKDVCIKDDILELAWNTSDISINGIIVESLKKIRNMTQLDIDVLFAVEEFVIA